MTTLLGSRRALAATSSYAIVSYSAPAALPAWLTLARATVGRYADASKVLQSAAINAARLDYDGAGASLGLLVESASTNLFLRSDECANAAWGAIRTAVTANVMAGWAGATTVVALTCNASGFCYHHQGPFTVSNGATVTHSRVLAAGTNNAPYLSIYDSAHRQAQFILSGNGSIANVDAGISAIIRKVATGLYICCITYAITGTSCYGTLFVSGNKSIIGTIGESVYCDIAQLEVGAFPSSRILTTTAAATRSADALTLGGGYSSNPLIVETQSMATGAVSRTLYNPGSGVSALANVWLRKAVIYPIGAPSGVLDAIVAGGAW